MGGLQGMGDSAGMHDKQGMKMSSNAAWTAAADSVRADLERMPKLAGAELTNMMTPHLARLNRLGTMHQQMIRTTPK